MKIRKTFAVVGLNLFLLAPRLALAAPGEGAVQKLIDLLTGNLARLSCILMAILIGYAFYKGERDMDKIKNWLIGTAFIVGSAWFADLAMTK